MTIVLHSEGGKLVSINHLCVKRPGAVLLLLLKAFLFDRFPPCLLGSRRMHQLLAGPASLQGKMFFDFTFVFKVVCPQTDILYTEVPVWT